MIRPPLFMRCAASRMPLKTPLRLTAMCRSNSASSASAIVASCMMPALLTSTSTWPNGPLPRRTGAASSAGLLTSARTATAVPPDWRMIADLCLGFLRTAGIVDDDLEAVAGQALGDCGSNAARGARHDCPLSVLSPHLVPL